MLDRVIEEISYHKRLDGFKVATSLLLHCAILGIQRYPKYTHQFTL